MPPTEEYLRERIMAAIAGRLGGILAGDDYFVKPAVTRALLEIDQYQPAQFPILGVMRADGSTVEADAHGDEAGRPVYEHLFHVAIWGYVIGDSPTVASAVPAGTKLERLWGDHRKRLMVDDTLAGLVINLSPGEGPGAYRTDRGAAEPRAWFEQHWQAQAHEALA